MTKKLHQKPTQEELKEKEEEAIAEAKRLEENPPDEEEEDVSIEEELSEEENPPDEEEEENPPDEEEEDKERLKQEVEEKKKKLSASARENQKIYAKNRVINQALIEAEDIQEPTQEEMEKEYSEWDLMSDIEKKFAKETTMSKQWRKVISKAKDQATKIEKWNESVDNFIDDPKTLNTYSELEGKEIEFREFAIREANNNVPFGILISAFLFEKSVNKSSKKGQMFERGKGGSKHKPKVKTGKISLEQARKLRTQDYGKYKEYLKAGKIDLNV